MKKRYVFLINCLLLFCTHLYAQPSSKQGVMGKRPYELDVRQVNRKATFDFTDINKWQIVDANNCKAALSRTSEQIVTVPFSGKIVYETEQPQASFYLSLKQPISVSQAWDCIDLWTFGDHWLWGEPASHTAMHAYVVIEDENKKIHEINTVQAGYSGLVHKYWMLNHVKFTEPFNAKAKFLGIKFKGNYTDVGAKHTLYLSSGYMYKEELKPLSFKPFPEKLPFPLRKETILPSNGNDYSIVIEQTEENSRFIYTDEAGELTYIINKHNPLHDISIHWNEKPFQTITNRKLVLADDAMIENLPAKSIVKKDTVWLESLIQWNNKQVPITFFYTIKQKSLIVGIEQKGNEGFVKEVHTGEIIVPNADKIAIPFLKYNHNDRPTILINDNKFSFMMFDWYHTNASNFTVGNPKAQTPFSGGKTIYIPKTDGKRNPAREKLFITVSSDIQEVLPTIDNPASPMRSMQADRLWAINGGANLDTLGKFVTDLRRKGVEKVTIRYHEDFWREGGESYTFKLTPNPQLGVKKIQDYIQFVKNQDWRVGLYTNYTDFAPVNALWNPDWVKQGPKGEWEVSWSRCYAPKPQIAWEQEAILAPQIAKLFNTNHSYCDVHTAVAPSTRVDYDYRTPDAGMMRGVIARYGMLLMNERKAYNGPVFSEGGNHWWYAGLADGNYANDDLEQLPVFPDFQLLKIHPLEMDAGNRGKGHAYIAYTLAYGNIGILSEGLDAIRRYAFLQPMQNEYVMRNVRSIEYADENGILLNSSQAAIKKLFTKPRLKIVYETGLEIFVNFNEQNWELNIGSAKIKLPQYGFYVYKPGVGLQSSSVVSPQSEKRLDMVKSENLFYLNTHGEQITGELAGKGEYMIKKEKFGWEIIPLADSVEVDFDIALLNIGNGNIRLEALDKEEKRMYSIDTKAGSQLKFSHKKEAEKYRIILL